MLFKIILKLYKKWHIIIKLYSFQISIYFNLVETMPFSNIQLEEVYVIVKKKIEYLNLGNQVLKGVKHTHQLLIGYYRQRE